MTAGSVNLFTLSYAFHGEAHTGPLSGRRFCRTRARASCSILCESDCFFGLAMNSFNFLNISFTFSDCFEDLESEAAMLES